MRTLISVVALVFSLAACNNYVESNVEAYSTLDSSVAGSSVFIEPTKGQNANGLSWSNNKSLLEKELSASGFNVIKRRNRANYIAYFGYAIDEGQVVTTNYSIPQYGVTGYSGANTYGSVYGNSYSSTTTLNPTYGVTGYSSGSRSTQVFTRSAKLFLQDRKSGKIVFEGSAQSPGTCHSFAPVAPYIIRAILNDFPNGKVGKVVLDLDKDYEC